MMIRRRSVSLLAIVSISTITPAAAQHSPCVAECADVAVVHAAVWTGVRGAADAQAVAARGGRIIAVGSDAEVNRVIGPRTRVVDAGGRMVVPGFIDSHVHFITGGVALSSVQLRDAATPAEFVRRIRDYARTLPAGAWITEGNWDHSLWGGELPRKEWIDSITPDNPVWINRLDGHMALANSAALRAAGVTAATRDVEGGEIVRGANGEPTGIFKDNALGLVDRAVPPLGAEQQDRALAAAMRHVAEQGVTSVQHMGGWDDLRTFRRARAAGRLRTRISAAVPLESWARLRDTVAASGRGDEWLR
ncbi:MAG TPA: amidohydrolase family protein, partial [Longimicrobium sp.]